MPADVQAERTPMVDDPEADRASALDRFARVGEGSARREVTVPQQMFGAAGDRVVGAQEVAVYRDEARVLEKLAALAAAAGDDWYYRYPVKNRKENRTDWIEGPSIKLANDLARIYGNCDLDIRVQDLGDSWLFYARFTDYETGFTLTRPFQQRKTGGRIGGDDDGRRLDIAFQIGVSKAERNVVVNALQTFADFAFEEAKKSLVRKVGLNLDGYRDRVLQGLTKANVDKIRVERVIGRASADWLAPDIARIIAMMKGIADGMATWEESFPSDEKIAADAKAGETTAKPSLDQFAKGETPPAKESEEQAAAKAAAGAADAKEAKPKGKPEAKAKPKALTDDDRAKLTTFAAALAKAESPTTLQKASSAFYQANDLEEGTPFEQAANAIYTAHLNRVKEEIGATDADNAVKKVLA